MQHLKRKSSHKENTPNRRRLDEKGVKDIMSLLKEWNSDPFDLTNQELRTLMSGEIADEKLVVDLETAQSDGEKLVKKIFMERLFSDEKSIYDTLHRQNRKSFADPSNNETKNDQKPPEQHVRFYKNNSASIRLVFLT